MLQLNNEYNYRFEQHRSQRSLEKLADDWHELIARAGGHQTPFQTPEWCLTWLQLNPQFEPCLITIRENDRLIFLAAFMRVKSLPGTRVYCFLSDPDCSYGNIIWDREEDPGLLFKDCVSFLKDEGNCDLLLLNNIPRDQLWLAGMEDNLAKSQLEYSSLLVINEKFRQDPTGALHKTVRRDVRHSKRRLKELGEYSVEVVDCDQGWREEVLPQMIKWKIAWLKKGGKWGGEVFDRGFEQFLFKLTENCGSGSLDVRSCIIRLDGQVISANLVFLQNQTIYGYFSSFDPSIKKASLGTLRDNYLVEWMLGTRFQAFDLLGHPEVYKERMTNRKLQLTDLRLALNRRGILVIAATALNLRDVAKRFFYKLPPGWRRSIIAVLRR